MKILYQSTSYIPSYSANSVHVMNMVNEISNISQNEVTLLALSGNIDINTDVYNYYNVDNKFKIIMNNYDSKIDKIKYIFKSLSFAIKYKPDLIISRFPFGVYILLLFGFKVVLDAHDPLWKGSLIKRVLWNIFKNFSNLRVSTNSESLKQIFIDANMHPKYDIVTAHNGANIKPLDEYYDLDNRTKFNIGYVGGLYSGRGIDIIIQIANLLPNVSFHIAGGTKKDILKLEKDRELPKNLNFYGHLDQSLVHKFRNSCDILLAPYHASGVLGFGKGILDSSKYMNPIKIIEYMSSKKVIIASDLKPIREVLNESNSMLVKFDNIEEWVKSIKLVMDDKKLYSKVVNNAYKDFLSKLTWKQRALKLLNLFEERN